jgi:hypothetical protein
VITDVDVVTAGDVIEHVVLVLSVVTVTEAVERAQIVVVGDVLVAVGLCIAHISDICFL